MFDNILPWTPLFLGLLVSFLTPINSAWYASLDKPPWTPPSWVFGPVWTVLYILMGFAAQRVLSIGGSLRMFSLQLVLNLAWSPIFFGAKNPEAALVILYLLNVTALLTTHSFWKTDRIAGMMMLPYIAWLGVATSLNTWISKSSV